MEEKLFEEAHKKTVWAHFAIAILGVWLFVAPFTFGYKLGPTFISDCVSGILLLLFGLRSLSINNTKSQWVSCLIGVWLQIAPLIFWAQEAVMYVNDTLVGVFVIIFSLVIPPLHGVESDTGPEILEGWSYNPSSWPQRMPTIVLAIFCWFTARYMAAYQLGYIDHISDPVFQDGTLTVITSSISRAFPVSDAGLGAVAYTLEALLGLKGGTRRFRTMPWLVVFFAFLVIPVGLVSVVLITLQPLVVHAWCFWCLLTALAMLFMIAFTVDEVMAVIQYLYDAKKAKLSLWHVFWHGGKSLAGNHDVRTPELTTMNFSLFKAMSWGVGLVPTLVITAMFGIFLMFCPEPLGIGNGLSVNLHICGALITVFSIIAMAEIVRIVRFIPFCLGIWIAVSSWIIDGASLENSATVTIIGALVALCSLPRGKIQERYGNLQKFIK